MQCPFFNEIDELRREIIQLKRQVEDVTENRDYWRTTYFADRKLWKKECEEMNKELNQI